MNTLSQKSRTATLVLCILLGMLGIHRMYAGKIVTGAIQMLLTITFILSWISIIWVLIDFVVILSGGFRDGKGGYIQQWNVPIK